MKLIQKNYQQEAARAFRRLPAKGVIGDDAKQTWAACAR